MQLIIIMYINYIIMHAHSWIVLTVHIVFDVLVKFRLLNVIDLAKYMLIKHFSISACPLSVAAHKHQHHVCTTYTTV